MSLSYTDSDLINALRRRSNSLANMSLRLRKPMSDLKAIAAEATLSTHAASILLRVVSSMALGFMLVRLLKFYTA